MDNAPNSDSEKQEQTAACLQDGAEISNFNNENSDHHQGMMTSVTPVRLNRSPSADSLKEPAEASDNGGLCNEAFEEGDDHLQKEEICDKTAEKDSLGENEAKFESVDLREDIPPLQAAPIASVEDCDRQISPCNSTAANNSQQQAVPSTCPINNHRIVHSRGASCASVAKDNCHSRGASTDGSTIDAYTSSATESRRGTYSEAGTLPVGMLPEGTPIIEENSSLGEKIVEKKLSNGVSSNRRAKKTGWKGVTSEVHHLIRPIMRKQNALPPDPSLRDKLKYALSCPPHGKLGRTLTWIIFVLLLWGSSVYITGPMAMPGGILFSLMILVITAELGGRLVAKLRLPPLLGMLIVGILYRSVPGINLIGISIVENGTQWSSSLRSIALVVILIRAGLGLDPQALKKLSFVVLRLAMLPCLTETITVAIMSYLLLGFPWKWAFMLGFILAAVSPAVVVPCLLNLSDQGYGIDKGIPTLVIAAASVDDVLAISGFGVMLGTTFSTGSAVWTGLKGPLELIMGVAYGICVGVIFWLLPYRHEKDATIFRFLMLFSAGLFAVFGSKGIDYSGAGALGCLCIAFVAGVGWRRQGWPDEETQVSDYFNLLWKFFQPMLFGLIGTEIAVTELDLNTIGLGVTTLLIGLTFRVLVSFFAVLGGGLNIKERFFVALAWLPKATVQAAIGSTALDYARSLPNAFTSHTPCTDYDVSQVIIGNATDDAVIETTVTSEFYESCEVILGKQVLTIAVLVILITAPIGAVAIMLSAPKLLKKTLPRGMEATTDPEAQE